MNGNVLAKSPANGAKEGLERSAEEVDENGSPEQKENCRSGCLDEVGEIGVRILSVTLCVAIRNPCNLLLLRTETTDCNCFTSF